MNNHLTLHLDELFDQAITSYTKIRTGEEVEAIHQLRVSLKKINAIFRLLSLVSPETFNAKSTFKPLKKLFDRLGKVRDLQIAQQVIAHYDLERTAYSANLETFINKRLLLAQNQLIVCSKKHTGVNHFEQVINAVQKLRPIGKARWLSGSSQYVLNQGQLIEALVRSRKRDKWHKIRIAVKRIRFVIDWALSLDSDYIPSDQYKKIRILGELLGDWHDRVIVLEMVTLQAKHLRGKLQQTAAIDFAKKLGNDQKTLLATARFYLRAILTTHHFSPN